VSHVTFDAPDLTLFSRLDALGLEAVGQRVKPGRAAIECRVVDSDEWCRRCGCQGAARDTVFDRPGTSNGPTEAIFECGAGWSGWQWSWRLGCDSRSNWPVSAVSSNAPQSESLTGPGKQSRRTRDLQPRKSGQANAPGNLDEPEEPGGR